MNHIRKVFEEEEEDAINWTEIEKFDPNASKFLHDIYNTLAGEEYLKKNSIYNIFNQ